MYHLRLTTVTIERPQVPTGANESAQMRTDAASRPQLGISSGAMSAYPGILGRRKDPGHP